MLSLWTGGQIDSALNRDMGRPCHSSILLAQRKNHSHTCHHEQKVPWAATLIGVSTVTLVHFQLFSKLLASAVSGSVVSGQLCDR